jgi:hypothetical protein
MNHGEPGFEAGNAVLGIETVDAEKLARPDALAGANVVFGAARAGDLLGML